MANRIQLLNVLKITLQNDIQSIQNVPVQTIGYQAEVTVWVARLQKLIDIIQARIDQMVD